MFIVYVQGEEQKMYEIRKYNCNDREQVSKLWVDIIVKEHNFLEWEDDVVNLQEERYEQILVAVFEGNVIGTIAYERIDDEIVELRRVYVYPEHRGNGLAKKLLDEIVKIIKEKKYKKLLVGTYENFVSGRRFYEKNNFTLRSISGDEYKYSLELE